MSKHLKNIGVVSFLTVVSRVMGLLREMISADIFGASVLNSAFLTAFRLPNLFRRLLGEGSLTAAFLPTLQHELHENGRAGAYELLNKVTSWLLVVTVTLVVLAMLFFGHLVAWGIAGFNHFGLLLGQGGKWGLVADLTVILFPYLAFVCAAAPLNATLNVFERFTEPALSPIWLNLAMIVSLGGAGYHFAHTKLGEMHWLCAGVLTGGFLQMAVPAGVLIKGGWRPRFDLTLVPRVREIARLMAPGFFGSAIYQVNITVSSLLAYSLTDFSSTIIYYSNRLMELPIGVFAIAISTVVYPLIARHAVAKNFSAMGEDFRKGIRLILIINLPAAAGLALLCLPIVRLLFQRGHFTEEDARLMAPLLALFVVGMPFFSIANMTVRAFYALKDTATPVKIATVDFTVNLVLSLLLMRRFGTIGLVMASTTAIIVQVLLLQRSLARRLPEMNFAPLWPTVGKVLVATAAMGALVWAGDRALEYLPVSRRLGDAVAVFGLIPAGVGVYAIALWLLRIEGRDELNALWKRFWRRGNPAPSL